MTSLALNMDVCTVLKIFVNSSIITSSIPSCLRVLFKGAVPLFFGTTVSMYPQAWSFLSSQQSSTVTQTVNITVLMC